MKLPSLVHYQTIEEYKFHYEGKYCNSPVMTFDNIFVRFRKSDFEHAFYESSLRDGNKDRFSKARAERIDWIESTLKDPDSERYQGWDSKKKRYDRRRRVAVVNGDYVVVIALTGDSKANFITAFIVDTAPTASRPFTSLDRIRNGPQWQ